MMKMGAAAGRRWKMQSVSYSDVQQAYAGYVYADSTAGQRHLIRWG